MSRAGTFFLRARGSGPIEAASFAAVFIFASVVPVYYVWLTPELFNTSLVMTAYFLWTYRLAVEDLPARDTRLERFLRSSRAEIAAAALLAIATFSKPTHLLLLLPMLAFALWKRRFRKVIGVSAVFALVVAALIAINVVTTGEANYQGGFRKTFYARTGFPFANPVETFDNRGQGMSTNAVPLDILFHRDTASVLAWNTIYSWSAATAACCRTSSRAFWRGCSFSSCGASRRSWQWFIAAGLVLGAVARPN